jgi:hypothetical protein
MINKLSKALEKRGQEFLNEEIIITEKLDTFRILFEKVGDEIKFFKKDNTEINIIERTLSNLWEQALLEIPTLIAESNIPEGIRFGVAYTPVERPNRIPYTKLPQYILTDMTRRTNGKITEIYEYDEISEWSKIFSMGRPPIIFEGILTDHQKELLTLYDNKEFESIQENSFSDIIDTQFGGTYSKENTIEGVILKDTKGNISQVTSYEFELLNEAYKTNSKSRDFYDLVILSLNNFMDKYSIPIFESKNPDQIYINIICDLFNNYIKLNPLTESFETELLTPPRYGYAGVLNTKFIENPETLNLLNEGQVYKSLFKVVLSSFRKYKKQYGLLTEKDVTSFNTYVGLINNDDKLFESVIPDLNEVRSDNIVVDTYLDKKASDIDNMRVIASVQKAFSPKKMKVTSGDQNCVVYVTDFNPFSKSQMNNIEALFRTWKVPIIIATVSNKRRVEGEDFHFTEPLIKAQMDSIHIFNKDIVKDTFVMSDWNLVEIFEFVRPTYEPIAIITDKGKKAEFVIQLFFEEEVMGGRIGVDKNLNIGEMDTNDKLKVMRALEDNSFTEFKSNTCQASWNLFNSMISEYKKYNGEILT